jgi:D-alanine-D-alanine ligase
LSAIVKTNSPLIDQTKDMRMANPSTAVTRKIILLYNMDSDWTRSDQREVRRLAEKMLTGLERQKYRVQPVEVYDNLTELDGYDPVEWLVFNWCEGFEKSPWSDSLVAKELETRGFAFTGSGSKILRKNQDKWRVKRALRAAKVPTPVSRVMKSAVEAEEWEYFPAIVKPVAQHSSVGISNKSVVDNREALIRQIRMVYGEFGQPALVEPFIDGREFHVAVWGNRKIEALPPVELDFSAFPDLHDRLYTYECKFIRRSRGMMGIDWFCPAPENSRIRARLRSVAVAAYRAIGCRDYARMDLRLWNNQPMVLDVNSNPDLHPESVFPMAAEAMGMNYGEMAERIVELAMSRLKRKRTMQSFDSSKQRDLADSYYSS